MTRAGAGAWRRGGRVGVGVVVLLGAGGGAVAAQQPPLPPAGHGTLRQADVSVTLSAGAVEMRIIPLDEGLLRLLAPDSYLSLRNLRDGYLEVLKEKSPARSASGIPFLFTVYGLAPDAEFDPQAFRISVRNQSFEPVSVAPISAGWSSHRVGLRETVSAIMLFDEAVSVFEPLVVIYGAAVNREWVRMLPTLERERARILTRSPF